MSQASPASTAPENTTVTKPKFFYGWWIVSGGLLVLVGVLMATCALGRLVNLLS